MSSRRHVAYLLVAAFAFGVLAAWVKGPGGAGDVSEIRSAIGNLSAPWLLVAFVAGTGFSRLPWACSRACSRPWLRPGGGSRPSPRPEYALRPASSFSGSRCCSWLRYGADVAPSKLRLQSNDPLMRSQKAPLLIRPSDAASSKDLYTLREAASEPVVRIRSVPVRAAPESPSGRFGHAARRRPPSKESLMVTP